MEEKKKVTRGTKTTRSTKSTKKVDSSKLRLTVINELDKFETVEVPIELRMGYIRHFGVEKVVNKSDLENWLNSQNV